MTLEDVGRGGGKEVGRMLEGCCKDVGMMLEGCTLEEGGRRLIGGRTRMFF